MQTCVLCGSKKFTRLFNSHGFDIFKCKKCFLTVTSNSGPSLNYKKYHRDIDYNLFEKQFRNIFLTRVNLIKQFTRSTGRVLEIGCATGEFLKLYKDEGWEVWGVEPSMSSKVAASKGIKVINSTFEEAALPKDYFDLVILNHTLEHVKNPLLLLKKVNQILKKEALLFIDVPNFGSLMSRLLGKRWPYLLPQEHNYHFIKGTLSKIVRKSGYEVLFTKSRSGIFEYSNPLKEILESLFSLKKRFLTNIFFFPYDLIATILDKGDSISLLAKKL